MSAGKGDRPRNCHTKRFRDNYDQIDWGRAVPEKERKRRAALDALSKLIKQQGFYK